MTGVGDPDISYFGGHNCVDDDWITIDTADSLGVFLGESNNLSPYVGQATSNPIYWTGTLIEHSPLTIGTDASDPVGGEVTVSIAAATEDCPPVVACTPCLLPDEDLCLAWTNSSTGPDNTALIYDPLTETWSSDCVEYATGKSLRVTISCTDGIFEIVVEHSATSASCEDVVSYSLSGGDLVFGSANCDLIDLIYDVADASTLRTSYGFGTFEITRGPCEPLACEPCDIPKRDLCLYWVNQTTGDAFAKFEFIAPDTWDTGCIGYTDGRSIRAILTCAGGSWDLVIFGDQDHSDCSTADPYTIDDGDLILGDYSCDGPFSVTYTVQLLRALWTKMGFTSFTIADGPCPPPDSCDPCELPDGDMYVTLENETETTGSALDYYGSYWIAPCTAWGDGAWSVLLKCDGGDLSLEVVYNNVRPSCNPASVGFAKGRLGDGLTLDEYTCTPLVLTFTVDPGTPLHNNGLRTVTVTL
ncbi:MAG: hypothetical protein ABS79_01530 [Planctomycetes bacterium SCN 63-9]|nr:MAG: hypothetical protein ABS79_01530 [Planctomycetes bacterium SCN 63-9]